MENNHSDPSLQVSSPKPDMSSDLSVAPTPFFERRHSQPKFPLINNNPKIKEGHASFTMASIQIGNTILGAGIISLPVVMRYLGIILGTVFIAFIAVCTIFSVKLLLIAQEITKKNKYSTIARSALGNPGYLFVIITIILNNFGLCCAFFRIFGETVQNTIQGFVSEDSILITNWHNYIYILILLVIMAFVIYTDNFESFEKTSSLGVVGIIVYVVGLFVIFFYKLHYNLLPTFSGMSFLPTGPFLELLANLPTVFLSYSFQFNVFPIYFTLQNREKSEMLNATSIAVAFCFFLYALSGLCCFLMYGTLLDDTTLKMLLVDMQLYKDKSTFLKIVLVITNIGFLTCSTTGIPLMFYSLKKNLFDSIKYYKRKWALGEKSSKKEIELTEKAPNTANEEKLDKTEELCDKTLETNQNSIESEIKDTSSATTSCDPNNTLHSENGPSSLPVSPNENAQKKEITKEDFDLSYTTKIISTIILYVLIGVVTILVPQLKTLFNCIGSTAANSISFIIPSLIIIYLSSKAETYVNMLLPKLLLVFGIVVMIVCLTTEIISACK